MAENHANQNSETDVLFKAILSLNNLEECYAFFEDLCTMKDRKSVV